MKKYQIIYAEQNKKEAVMKMGTRVKVTGKWWNGEVGVYIGDEQSGLSPFEFLHKVELENGFSGMFRTEEMVEIPEVEL